MKKVWKCDFCGDTFSIENVAEAEKHEKECDWNPANQTCMTCLHRFEDGAPISGTHDACHKGHSCEDRSEDDYKDECSDWENESET